MDSGRVFSGLHGPRCFRGAVRGRKRFDRRRTLLRLCHGLHPNRPPAISNNRRLLCSHFRSPGHCSLNQMKHCGLGHGLQLGMPSAAQILAPASVLATVSCLVGLRFSVNDVSSVSRLNGHQIHSINRLLRGRIQMNLGHLRQVVQRHVAMSSTSTLAPTSLIGPGPLITTVGRFFNSDRLSRFVSRAGPLTRLARGHQVDTLNPNNLAQRQTNFTIHSVRPSRCKHVYPVRAPRNPGTNLVNSLTARTQIGRFNFVRAPFFGTRGNQILGSQSPVCVATSRRSSLQITPKSVTASRRNCVLTSAIPIHCQRSFAAATSARISCMTISPMRVVSMTASLVPFLRRSSTGHTLVKSGVRQRTMPLLRPRHPLMNANLRTRTTHSSKVIVVDHASNRIICLSTSLVGIRSPRNGVRTCRLRGCRHSGRSAYLGRQPVIFPKSGMRTKRILTSNSTARNKRLTLKRGVLMTCVP